MSRIFDFENTAEHPRLIAHRGFTPVAPENSIPSFEAAGKLGFWAIETDIHKTRDGVLVCCHNSSMEKMYGEDIFIEENTLESLMKLRISRGNMLSEYSDEELRIPLYSEYLAICVKYGAVPFIESKGLISEEIVDVLRREGLEEYSVFSSITFDHIEQAMSVSDKIYIHHIFSNEQCMHRIAERGNSGLSYNYTDLSLLPAGLIEHTHDCGVKVCLRAGDTVEKCYEMLSLGLDYIPTNKIFSLM